MSISEVAVEFLGHLPGLSGDLQLMRLMQDPMVMKALEKKGSHSVAAERIYALIKKALGNMSPADPASAVIIAGLEKKLKKELLFARKSLIRRLKRKHAKELEESDDEYNELLHSIDVRILEREKYVHDLRESESKMTNTELADHFSKDMCAGLFVSAQAVDQLATYAKEFIEEYEEEAKRVYDALISDKAKEIAQGDGKLLHPEAAYRQEALNARFAEAAHLPHANVMAEIVARAQFKEKMVQWASRHLQAAPMLQEFQLRAANVEANLRSKLLAQSERLAQMLTLSKSFSSVQLQTLLTVLQEQPEMAKRYPKLVPLLEKFIKSETALNKILLTDCDAPSPARTKALAAYEESLRDVLKEAKSLKLDTPAANDTPVATMTSPGLAAVNKLELAISLRSKISYLEEKLENSKTEDEKKDLTLKIKDLVQARETLNAEIDNLPQATTAPSPSMKPKPSLARTLLTDTERALAVAQGMKDLELKPKGPDAENKKVMAGGLAHQFVTAILHGVGENRHAGQGLTSDVGVRQLRPRPAIENVADAALEAGKSLLRQKPVPNGSAAAIVAAEAAAALENGITGRGLPRPRMPGTSTNAFS